MSACAETFTLGPFRFECTARGRNHGTYDSGRVVEHRSSSPRQPGDCEVVWWTADEDG